MTFKWTISLTMKYEVQQTYRHLWYCQHSCYTLKANVSAFSVCKQSSWDVVQHSVRQLTREILVVFITWLLVMIRLYEVLQRHTDIYDAGSVLIIHAHILVHRCGAIDRQCCSLLSHLCHWHSVVLHFYLVNDHVRMYSSIQCSSLLKF